MEDEENLKRITKLLEQGCTMLATHHSCGAPLFRCKGQIICPICSIQQEGDIEIERVSSAPKGGLDSVTSSLPSNAKETELTSITLGPLAKQEEKVKDINQTARALRIALFHKLDDLRKCMEEENDIDRLNRILECMRRILEILKILDSPDELKS